MLIFCSNLSSFPASPGITQTDAASSEHHHPCPSCLKQVPGIGAGVWLVLGGVPRALLASAADWPLCPLASTRHWWCVLLTSVWVSAGLLVLDHVPVVAAVVLCLVAHLEYCMLETLCIGPSYNCNGFLCILYYGSCSPSPPPRGSHWL